MRISLKEAVSLLKAGRVVAVPTDTVYGLAAPLKNVAAIEHLYDLKGRPSNKPMIVQVSDYKELIPFVHSFPPGFEAMVKKFWPGVLTLIIPVKTERISKTVRSGLSTVGFRVPNHPVMLELLQAFGPLVIPSANLSGKPSATCAKHVENDFGEMFPVLDGGESEKGIESTILFFSNDVWNIQRAGALAAEDFTDILGYTPLLTESKGDKLNAGILSKNMQVCFHQYNRSCDEPITYVLGFDGRNYACSTVFSLGSLSNPEEIVHRFYSLLREIEVKGITNVWVDMDFPREGLLETIALKLERVIT